MVGDTPQGLMGRLTEQDAEYYFADREAHGFNTLGWIDVMCAGNDYRTNKDAVTPDGIKPFTGYVAGGTDFTHYDLSKPNEAYFTRLDHIIQLAAKHHLLVFLDPIETIGWLPALRNNGEKAAYAYGQFLGNRYKGLRQRGLAQRQRLQPLDRSRGRQAWCRRSQRASAPSLPTSCRPSSCTCAPVRPSMIRAGFRSSSSMAHIPIRPLTSRCCTAITRSRSRPWYMIEAHYDWENVGEPPDFGTPLRAAQAGLLDHAHRRNRPMVWQQVHMVVCRWLEGKNRHARRRTTRHLVESSFRRCPGRTWFPTRITRSSPRGYGTFGNVDTRVSESDYATAARTPDGATAVIYVPTVRDDHHQHGVPARSGKSEVVRSRRRIVSR